MAWKGAAVGATFLATVCPPLAIGLAVGAAVGLVAGLITWCVLHHRKVVNDATATHNAHINNRLAIQLAHNALIANLGEMEQIMNRLERRRTEWERENPGPVEQLRRLMHQLNVARGQLDQIRGEWQAAEDAVQAEIQRAERGN